jgi:hypothetical protein
VRQFWVWLRGLAITVGGKCFLFYVDRLFGRGAQRLAAIIKASIFFLTMAMRRSYLSTIMLIFAVTLAYSEDYYSMLGISRSASQNEVIVQRPFFSAFSFCIGKKSILQKSQRCSS